MDTTHVDNPIFQPSYPPFFSLPALNLGPSLRSILPAVSVISPHGVSIQWRASFRRFSNVSLHVGHSISRTILSVSIGTQTPSIP